MDHSSFVSPDVDVLFLLRELGLTVVGQQVTPSRIVLERRIMPARDEQWCTACGCHARSLGTKPRWFTHIPIELTPVKLLVRIRYYMCVECGQRWRQDTTRTAQPRHVLTRTALEWALHVIVVDHVSLARIAARLSVDWHTVNDAILALTEHVLIRDPTRRHGVRVLGVDEHVWRYQRHGPRYVTVLIDVTPVAEKTGAARLIAMVPGRSKSVFKAWLDQQTQAFKDGIKHVAMDGFAGYKTAATEAIPAAVPVMDSFHVVALAGQALDDTRTRVQQEIHGHRGRTGDPLYGVRRVLRTGLALLTDRQACRLDAVFVREEYAAVEITWRVYQDIVTAYREPHRYDGKQQLQAVINTLHTKVPIELNELRRLGKTLHRRATDILAYFDHPGTSNGPTEAINGRLEHLRGIGYGFRNLTNYITRALLETGGFKQHLTP